MRQVAVQIKALRQLRAQLPQDASVQWLEDRLQHLQLQRVEYDKPAQRVQNAARVLAEARARLGRAERHLAEATALKDKAVTEVKVAETAWEQAKALEQKAMTEQQGLLSAATAVEPVAVKRDMEEVLGELWALRGEARLDDTGG
eukprot:9563215-Lingulodinium_polyedra.AAC.1